jgi:hypothetical protein
MTKFRIDLAIVGSLLERQDNNEGWIQDFKLGGAQLKILRRAEGGAKIFGVFGVKNHDFTPKIYFFPIAEGGAKTFGVFCVKNHDFTPTNHIFPILGGVGCPLDPPLIIVT